ncbi:hypothetical protein [Lentzea guizhouensis]|nr:hypothetical protein [Lentzea guizhouensis]
MLPAPLLTCTATVAINGNGFVASFACGIATVLTEARPVARWLARSQ